MSSETRPCGDTYTLQKQALGLKNKALRRLAELQDSINS